MSQRARVGRPPDGDSAETRRRILQTARRLFALEGYRSTTNRQIAGEVGITSGAIYHYFESKDELYAAVYCATIDEMYTEFERSAAAEETLLNKFAAVMGRSGELVMSDPSITGFIVAVALETKRRPELLELMAPQRGRNQRFFEQLVAEAVERGELEPDIDQRAVVDVLGSVLTGVANMPAVAADPDRYVAAVKMIERFLRDHRQDG